MEVEKNAMIFKLPDLSRKIIQLIQKYSSIGISEIASLANANKNTVKKHLAALVDDSHIAKYGKGKSTKYRILQ
ncbi:hypothetical protein FACS189449_01200 [Alphaproteobacteria bacterium]|nr:hypothetical protein FACS189449_01200 [Alphaproteobacteria bacterium]